MEIANQITKSKHEAEQAARKSYRELLSKERAVGEEAPERDVQQVLDAMEVLGISPEQAEEDSRLYLDVITATVERDAALAEAEKLGPSGDRNFQTQLDDLDVALAEAVDKLLRPKRRLIAQAERYDAAAETLKAKESLLATKRNAVPRLTG